MAFTAALSLVLATSISSGRGGGLLNPCLDKTKPFAKMPFCDATLDIDARVSDAVSRMTLQEKIGALDTGGNPINSLGLPPYNWWSEASSGVSNGGAETTKFAYPITTGMSFNRTLWQLTGRQIGREARALMNSGQGESTFWAPVVNLAREPRWGRNIEVPGEDPYLSGEYATWFVNGFERAPEDPGHIQASACCKHYVANSMESTREADGESYTRHNFDASISQQDLVDSYMLPFQACVEKGKVTGLMCSYNAVNGVPSCANNWLLSEVARGAWGFDGYVTSDCGADNDVVQSHHFADTNTGVKDVLRAGTDVDCGSFVGRNAMAALNASVITQKDIDDRLKMLFRVRMRLGHFDPAGPLQQIPESTICSDYAKSLSHNGPVQSSALLKNSDDTLPFTKSKSFAVIGPNANLSQETSGYYGPRKVCDNKFWTLVDTVAKYASSTSSAIGVPGVSSSDESQIPHAVALAKAVDHVVLAVGTDLTWAHEGHDSTNISFPAAQVALIEQVAAAAKSPVTVIIMTANPLDISFMMNNPKIGAVMHTGQPSLTVYGLAEVLFGDISPAGRTIQTVYPSSYQDEVSIFDFNMRPGPSDYARPDCTKPSNQCPKGTNPGRTHRFYTGDAVVPFGFGLSYTTFSYNLVSSPSPVLSLDPVRDFMEAQDSDLTRSFPSRIALNDAKPLVEYVINVTNTGKMDSDHVVLGFTTPPNSGKDGVPLQTLFGFERVHVKAGETVSVYLYPELSEFTFVDVNGVRQVHAGEYTFKFGIKEMASLNQGYLTHSVSTI